MSAIIGFFGKYVIAAALVLAYIDAGPGGEKVGIAVDTVKEAVLSVDWSKVASEVAVLIENTTNEPKEVTPIEEKT